jgi:hypothetical protein
MTLDWQRHSSDEESVAPRYGRTVVGVVSALLSLIVVASCTGGSRSDGARSRETPRAAVTPPRAFRNVVVTRDDDSIVSVCRPANVARRLIRFSRGLRTGRETALRRFWGAGFEWFSVGGRSSTGSAKWHFVAYRSRKALRYVQDQRGLNLRVDELEVALRPGSRGADVVYAGRWMGTGRSGRTDRLMSGKGFVDCRRPTIRVWSMVVWERDVQPKGHLCPEPESGLEPGMLLVCVRGHRS